MKNKNLAVCDTDMTFAYSLSEYINNQRGDYFFSEAFSKMENLSEYSMENNIDIIVVCEAMAKNIKENMAQCIIVLSEAELVSEKIKWPVIYKYQSASSIVKEIMEKYSECEDTSTRVINKSCEFIGVYSPLKRVLKTSFALTMGQIMSREARCLYINMEDYSGFSELFDKEYNGDLSDVMYYLRQDNINFMAKLGAITETIENMDYIPPVPVPFCIREIKKSEWEKLFEEISTKTSYEKIIVDFEDNVDGLMDLLSLCTKIYMPVKDDYISNAKIKQFERMLDISKKSELHSKIKKIKLPYHNNCKTGRDYTQQLVYSEFGDYVRELIR